ncbi:hypothetical protein VTN02DRAFT_4119 [Thermoascus thermophilus]
MVRAGCSCVGSERRGPEAYRGHEGCFFSGILRRTVLCCAATTFLSSPAGLAGPRGSIMEEWMARRIRRGSQTLPEPRRSRSRSRSHGCHLFLLLLLVSGRSSRPTVRDHDRRRPRRCNISPWSGSAWSSGTSTGEAVLPWTFASTVVRTSWMAPCLG